MLLENIRRLCKEYTISITNLEKALGFGNGTITKWDKGSPSVEKVKQVADFFEVSVSYLIGEEKEKAPSQMGEDSIFADKFSQLDEADKAYISGQIDALLSKRG